MKVPEKLSYDKAKEKFLELTRKAVDEETGSVNLFLSKKEYGFKIRISELRTTISGKINSHSFTAIYLKDGKLMRITSV